MLDASGSTVSSLVNRIRAADELGAQPRAEAVDWLARSTDIYRRVKPRTPSPHLVSYFLLMDRAADSVLLCDHRLSGLWLPTGGHVEPGEHPVETVRREAAEELGIEAEFDPTVGLAPFFLTVTETVGAPEMRHTDVSLWFALSGTTDQQLLPDEREFVEVRWWTLQELRTAHSSRFEPHLIRALDALASRT
jgi:8-oxo-dGTP diphosphatase